MTRRLISALTACVGLIVIALAVCSATVWRPSATVVATLSSRPQQPYVLLEPGVLGLVNADVTVEASADGEPVLLAVGYAEDVRAWLADDPYLSVTGLQDWDTLAATPVTRRCEDEAATASASAAAGDATSDSASLETASAAEQASPQASEAAPGGCVELTTTGANPTTSDLWLLSETGEGTATLKVDASDPQLVMLVATDGSGPAPTVTVTWPRTVSTPWLLPGLVAGGIVLLLGVFGLLVDFQARRAHEAQRRRAAERAARLATADSTMTLGIPALTDPNRPLTRRERREKERAELAGEEWVDPRTGPVVGAGAAVAGAEELAGEVVSAAKEMRVAGGEPASDEAESAVEPEDAQAQDADEPAGRDGEAQEQAVDAADGESVASEPDADPGADAEAEDDVEADARPQDEDPATEDGGAQGEPAVVAEEEATAAPEAEDEAPEPSEATDEAEDGAAHDAQTGASEDGEAGEAEDAGPGHGVESPTEEIEAVDDNQEENR